MIHHPERFVRFAEAIAALDPDTLSRDQVLTPTFRLAQQGPIDIYYMPCDYVNATARVVLIGITPGTQQLCLAYQAAARTLREGGSVADAHKQADESASFAGTMRPNLVKMLDTLGLPAALGIESSAQLFGERADLVQTTSAIRDAVVVRRKNYGGHTPPLLRTPLLRGYVDGLLVEELQLASQALLIPLGETVSEVLQALIQAGHVDPARCLLGFPHPSGQNGYRSQYFRERQDALASGIDRWFRRSNGPSHSPRRATNQLDGRRQATTACPFCRIVEKLDPAEVVYETDETLAFFPLEPATRGHTLVIPKRHIANFFDLSTSDTPALGRTVLHVAHALRHVLQPEGMNIITSAGEAASQSVNHLHVHLVPRWTGDAVGEIWPPKHPTSERVLESVADQIRAYCRSESLEHRNPE